MPFDYTDVDLTYTGPGTAALIDQPSDTEYVIEITGEGIYDFVAKVTDTDGHNYTDTIGIVVLDPGGLDALLRAKWHGMKQALMDGDVERALGYFVDRSREKYRKAFNVITNKLPQIISDMQDIEMIYIKNGIAKYRINRIHVIEGEPVTIAYYIYYTVDVNGVWKIDKF